jgi:tetratricopeptide (TPR) repeat protein
VLLKRILYPVVLIALLASCSTKKNTVVSRAYHNITARYNGYYYSNENLDEGVYKTERAHKDNFEKVLPVYIYPTPEKAKSTFPDFDKAIKKSSLCIQKHAIKDKKGNEIASAGKWIDNNWINIGKSHFYKREFFSAIETFEYVIRTYNKSNDKYTAMIWLIKANNEIGAVSSSEPIISLLKNERKLPRKIKNELPVVWADYYMRRGQNTEAVAKLMEATRNAGFLNGIPKKKRARYSFIIGQLSEQAKDNNRAVQYYRKTIKLKPNYEMVFYSKIKIARLLDVKRSNSEKTKRDLLKMSREFKNSDYYDVIFYTLGEIEEKERNINQALNYYKKSVQTSVSNVNQKALSFLKLGEINFDLTNYQAAEAYYDSTIATLPSDHPDYNSILARKKTLESLVGHIRTITKEDSLQRIAKMSEKDRNDFIDKLIVSIQKEEERRRQEQEALMSSVPDNNNSSTNNNTPPSSIGGSANFYFYNPTTVAFGVADFTKKWGNRKLEDDWRRFNKAVTIEDEKTDPNDSLKTKKDTAKVATKSRDFYMKDLPMTDSLIKKSNTRIIRAYYMMGTIYKEELNNTKKTIAAFEDLNTRFPENKYLLNTYYILYRIYLDQKNTAKAEYYKNKILNEFPDSQFAALIKNPDYAKEINTAKSEAEAFYAELYDAYTAANYSQSYSKASEGIAKFGKNEYLPKFEFIRAMSLGKLKGVDTLEYNLKLVAAKYPTSEVTPLTENILLAIKKQKNPELFKPKEQTSSRIDTFTINMEAQHFIAAVVPDQPKIADGLKSNIGMFNTIYYSEKKFDLSSTLFGTGKQLILLKSFPNAKEALNYYENLMGDPDVFRGDVKREVTDVFPIMAENVQFLYKSKNVAGYKLFYEANYKNVNSKN